MWIAKNRRSGVELRLSDKEKEAMPQAIASRFDFKQVEETPKKEVAEPTLAKKAPKEPKEEKQPNEAEKGS